MFQDKRRCAWHSSSQLRGQYAIAEPSHPSNPAATQPILRGAVIVGLSCRIAPIRAGSRAVTGRGRLHPFFEHVRCRDSRLSSAFHLVSESFRGRARLSPKPVSYHLVYRRTKAGRSIGSNVQKLLSPTDVRVVFVEIDA